MSKKEKDGNFFKRHKILTVIGVIIVIGIIASAAGGGSKKNASTTAKSGSSTSSTAKPTTAGLNQPADDGKFEFTVSAFKCGIPSVSDSTGYLSKSAQGQYCELTVAVKNIGNQAQTFDGSSQYLLNATGQKYNYDSTATIYANPSDSTFLNTINPGNSATGTIVFDVPQGTPPTTAEMHDSSFSNGVKVTLQ